MQNNSGILSGSYPAEDKEWPEGNVRTHMPQEVDYQFFPLKSYRWPENS